jgi:hypothetical protein
MILHRFWAGSRVVTDPGCCPSAAGGASLAPLFGGRNPDQAFLDDRGDEAAVAPEDLAARQPTRPGCGWGLLEVQQPVVGAERSVEPHGVIQTGPSHAVLVQANPEPSSTASSSVRSLA